MATVYCAARAIKRPWSISARAAVKRLRCPSILSISTETAEKVGFDDFRIQDTGVEKIQLQYFVGEIPDFGLFQQSPTRR
jgi:hypothetical protein